MADHLTAIFAIWLLSIGTVAAAAWLANAITARQLRDRYWREFNTRRRGGNPPPPGRKPAPPAGPPLIASQADAERLAAQLQENAKELIAAGYANESRELLELGIQVAGAATYLVSEKSIRFDEGPTQRGNGDGGPTTPKPLIKPQPTGPRMVGDSIKPPPIKPQFPPPRKIREDFL